MVAGQPPQPASDEGEEKQSHENVSDHRPHGADPPHVGHACDPQQQPGSPARSHCGEGSGGLIRMGGQAETAEHPQSLIRRAVPAPDSQTVVHVASDSCLQQKGALKHHRDPAPKVRR